MSSWTCSTGLRARRRAPALFLVAVTLLGPAFAMFLPGCAPAREAVDPPKPFVTWDQDTVVPFMCYDVGEPGSESFRAYLGLWDLARGIVSFTDTPVLDINREVGFPVWDGGDRFLVDDARAKALDARARMDIVERHGFAAAPSGSDAVFSAYRESGKVVIEVRNHPLAAKIVADPPELPPGTEIVRAVGIECGSDKVTAYFETLRFDEDTDSGYSEPVMGILQAKYVPAATARPVQ